MNYAVKWEWNRQCGQSAGQKVKSVTPISSLSPYCPLRGEVVRMSRMTPMIYCLFLFLFLLDFYVIALPTHAASFDCMNAKTVMEKTICSDQILSAMDEKLAKLYGAAKAGLKERPDERKKLIESQRDWLAGLKPAKGGKSPCAANVDCLKNSFHVRIGELQHELAKLYVAAPAQEIVVKRLTSQLEQLKEILSKSKEVKIREALSANKPAICNKLWNNLQQGAVPVPDVFANTVQQKREIFNQLRKMAIHNQRLFISPKSILKNSDDYKKNFDYAWNEKRNLGDYDDKRKDSVMLLFYRPDTSVGTKQPVIVIILLDLEGDGLSLDRSELAHNGLWLTTSLGHGSYSQEYYQDNLLGESQIYISPPHQKAGLLSFGGEILYWKLSEGREKDSWWLILGPVPEMTDIKSARKISCSFEFQI